MKRVGTGPQENGRRKSAVVGRALWQWRKPIRANAHIDTRFSPRRPIVVTASYPTQTVHLEQTALGRTRLLT